MHQASNVKRLAPLVLVAGVAIAIYAYVLPLPFFRDDMVMLLWLRDMSWGRLWVDATGFPYYRPLSFSTLKLSELVLGWPEPISLHVLNLVLHAANSVMVALLAERFFGDKGKRVAAISAGLLFAAYPFTYEVIPTTGPIFQLQAAFFGLSAALCYAEFKRQTSNVKWLGASLALALLGAFTCEYGVIIPAFIMLIEIMIGRQERIPTCAIRFSPILLIYWGFSVLYLVIWVIVPKSRAEPPLILQGLDPALRDMSVTALYYLQGLTYPLQTLAWPLVRATGLSNQLAVGLIALLTLVGIVALFVWAKKTPLLVFTLTWFLIAVAPMWPTLNADYTLNGPRLHYLPSMASSLIWGNVVAILWEQAHHQDTRGTKTHTKNLGDLRILAVQTLSVLVFAATLAQSLVFLYGMADLITIGGQLTADVSRAIAATSPDEPSLVVNFPSWIGKKEGATTFALGEEGISFLPGYSTMRDLVRLNTRQDRHVTSVTFTNTIKEWKYHQRLGQLVNWNGLVKAVRAARRVWAIEYLPDTLRLSEAGAVLSMPASQPQATFDERVSLKPLDARLAAGELRVELEWTTAMTVERQLTAFVHVYDAQGRLVAQQDGYPLLGLYPPWLSRQGECVRDVRHIPLPDHLPAGHYTVGVGMYDAETSQRVEALSPAGERFENDVYLFHEFDLQRQP